MNTEEDKVQRRSDYRMLSLNWGICITHPPQDLGWGNHRRKGRKTVRARVREDFCEIATPQHPWLPEPDLRKDMPANTLGCKGEGLMRIGSPQGTLSKQWWLKEGVSLSSVTDMSPKLQEITFHSCSCRNHVCILLVTHTKWLGVVRKYLCGRKKEDETGR